MERTMIKYIQMNKITTVLAFGENGSSDQWYEDANGNRVKCNETIIDHLWWQWITNEGAKRADDEKYTIFITNEKYPLYL